jgi:hypothetical protein
MALEFGFGFGRVLNPKLSSLSLFSALYYIYISWKQKTSILCPSLLPEKDKGRRSYL